MANDPAVKLCISCQHVEMGDHLREMYKVTGSPPHGSNLRCGRTQDVLVGDAVYCSMERQGTAPARYPNSTGPQCGPTGTYWMAVDGK